MTVSNSFGQWISRWLMRLEAAGGIIRMVSLGLTGLSTAVLALKQYGYGEFARPIAAALVIGGFAYAYIYTEWGLFNQKNRDGVDAGDNYSGPTMYMDGSIEAWQLALHAHMIAEDEMSFDERLERFDEVTKTRWAEMRDGVNIEQIEERRRQ